MFLFNEFVLLCVVCWNADKNEMGICFYDTNWIVDIMYDHTCYDQQVAIKSGDELTLEI